MRAAGPALLRWPIADEVATNPFEALDTACSHSFCALFRGHLRSRFAGARRSFRVVNFALGGCVFRDGSQDEKEDDGTKIWLSDAERSFPR